MNYGRIIFWIGSNDKERIIIIRAYCGNDLEEKIALSILTHLAEEAKRFHLMIRDEYSDFEPETLINIRPINVAISLKYFFEADKKEFMDYVEEMSCF